MILDERTEFCDATSVGTPNNTTVLVGDQIDLTSIGRDIGAGQPTYLVIQVVAAVTSGGAATVSFLLASDAAAAIAVDGTQTVHYESAVTAVATLVAGYTFVVALPMDNPTYERYLGIQVRENAGQVLTGGTINAFLTADVAKWKSYADATN